MEFEWDHHKAAHNLKKHGVDFAERSFMKTKVETPLDDELRSEYDETLLKDGVRGKYVARYRQGTNLVLLAPDVAAAFPTEKAVNEALRLLMQVAKQATTVTSQT